MAFDLSKSTIELVTLVVFRWHTSTARYCRNEDAVTVDIGDGDGSQAYSPVPAMTWAMDKAQQGGTRDNPVILKVPADLTPVDAMLVEVHAPVTAEVWEVNHSDLSNPRCVFIGTISKTKYRPVGQSDLVDCTVVGRRARLKDIPLGIVCTNLCAWTFGGLGCGKTVPEDTSVTIQSISQTNLYVTGIANGNSAAGGYGYYTRGYVEKDSLRIMIRRHVPSGDPVRLRLAFAPPSSWEVGNTITVVAGCGKRKQDCTYWGQQANFGGFGLKMPRYHPVIEDGACSS